jgi:hypothetical protein
MMSLLIEICHLNQNLQSLEKILDEHDKESVADAITSAEVNSAEDFEGFVESVKTTTQINIDFYLFLFIHIN